MNGLRKAMHPLFIIASLHGVQMFEYRARSLNYLQFLTLWIIYFTVLYILCNYTDVKYALLYSMFGFVFLSSLLTSLVATSLTLLYKKKFQRCLEDIAVVNKTLEYLDQPNDYDKLIKFMWKFIIVACCLSIYVTMMDATWVMSLYKNDLGIIVLVILEYPFVINIITYTIFSITLEYIGWRFDIVNKQIERFVKDNTQKSFWASEFYYYRLGQSNLVITKKQEEAIWVFMHIHNKLCKISRKLNEVFELQTTFEVSSYFMYIAGLTVFSYKMYEKCQANPDKRIQDEYVYIFMAYTRGVMYIIRLVYFNHICETISCKANFTQKCLHCFLNSANNYEIHAQVSHFSLNILNRPLRFTGLGMFYFGYNFVCVFFSAVSSIAVIILQTLSGKEY